MTILNYPNDALLVKCKAVEKVTPELQEIAKAMYKVMLEAGGIGLAANQVGLDIRLLVLDDAGPVYMFNPTLMKKSTSVQSEMEGCLSFPGEFKKIKRSEEVTVKYRDINGKMVYRVLSGIMAVAFQHELDHLNGKLFNEYEKAD